jgi:hypothetical protein
MALWHFHEVYKALDVEFVYWYPNKCPLGWWEDFLNFDGDPSSAIVHVVIFSKYTFEMDVIHDNVLVRLFILSLDVKQRDWVRHYCIPKRIPSMVFFLWEFLKCWGAIF